MKHDETETGKEDLRGQVVRLTELAGYQKDAVVSRTIVDKSTGTVTLFAFDAGQGLSEHTSPYDATILVIEGKAGIMIGGRRLKVGAGKLVIMPAGVPHSVRAVQRFKMLLIMIR